MKNLKNKFIFLIIFLILLIIWIETYSFYSIKDTNSYVTLTNWSWFVDNKELILKERELIKVWNIIKTVWEESIAIIEWWDSSITRLWWNTQMVIKENNISSDLSKIQISINLIKWKTRNNLVSIFWKDSYFNYYVNDIEAWVRWTKFEINIDKDYVYVENHEIKLKNTKTQSGVILTAEKPLKLSTFSLLDLQEFLINIKDKTWQEINNKLDKEMISNMQESIWKNLQENNPLNFILAIFSKKYSVLYYINNQKELKKVKQKITKLSLGEKQFVYDKVFYKYQKINFLSPTQKQYNKKLYYKQILLYITLNEKNTESLIKNSLYDINDIVSSNNLSNLKDTINILVENKDIIKNLNIDFNKYVDLTKIPDSLKKSMLDSLKPLKDIFKIPDLNYLLDKTKWGLDTIKTNVWWLIESIKQ